MSDARNPAREFPWPLSVVVGVALVALGWSLWPVLAPPLVAAFLVYLLLPFRRQAWVLRTLVVVGLVTLLWLLSTFGGILLILGVSMFLAYLLNTPVSWLEGRGIRRSLGILAILIPLMAILALAGILLIPPLLHQIRQLIELIPDLASKAEELAAPLLTRLRLEELSDRYSEQIPGLLERVNQIVVRGFSGVLELTRIVGSLAAAAVLVPICTFYFLRDYERVQARGQELIPRKYHPWFSRCGEEMDHLLGRWLRGVAVVSLLVGVLTGAGLVLLEVPYPLALATLAGVLNFIPVVGFWVSFLAAALVALATLGWLGLLKVGGLYLAISILEGQLLQPRIVGKAVGLHPVAVLLALILFARIFGLLGAFVAVPLALLVTILGRQLLSLYLASDLYDDAEPEPGPKGIGS